MVDRDNKYNNDDDDDGDDYDGWYAGQGSIL